jgi:hypothetical protein
MTECTMPHPAARRCAVLALVLVTAAGCGKSSGDNVYQQQRQAQTDAAAALREMGATVEERNYPQGKSWAVGFSGKQVSSKFFDSLPSLGYITDLDLSNTNVTDADMPRINEPKIGGVLLRLDLGHTAVTDAGLDQLQNLFLLTSMNLVGTGGTPAGVQRFLNKRANDSRIKPLFKTPTLRLQ